MPTPDGKIGARDLCAGAAVERVIADGGVTSLKISATLQSDNFATGSAGWQINRATGSAEFQDVVVRGTLNADDITVGTLSVDRIGANSIGMGKIELAAALEATQYIQSTTYTPGSAGWRIEADGTAEFDDVIIRGTITAGAGSDVDWSYIGNVAIVNADITSLSADKINAGTLSASYIDTGTIGAYTINLANSASSKITSNNGTDWYIRGDGVALFNDVTISGTLSTNSVTGWLTTGSGGGLRTASSGERIEIAEATNDRILFYTGTAGETSGNVAFIEADAAPTSGSLHLYGSRRSTEIELYETGGIGIIKFSGDSFTFDNDVTISGGELFLPNGTVSIPAIRFSNDTDTGIYRYAADSLAIAAGAARRLTIDANYTYMGSATYSGAVRNSAGAVGTPVFTFQGDYDTGLYHIGTDGYFAVAVNGAIGMQWGPTANKFIYGLTTGTQNVMHYNSGTGQITYVSSTERIKKNIQQFQTIGVTDLLRPVWYEMRDRSEVVGIPDFEGDLSGPAGVRLGLIAEDVAAVIPEAAVYHDDDPIPRNYDDRAIIAAVVADLQNTRRRVEALEQQ